MQDERLREQLAYLAERGAFYQERFADAGEHTCPADSASEVKAIVAAGAGKLAVQCLGRATAA